MDEQRKEDQRKTQIKQQVECELKANFEEEMQRMQRILQDKESQISRLKQDYDEKLRQKETTQKEVDQIRQEFNLIRSNSRRVSVSVLTNA